MWLIKRQKANLEITQHGKITVSYAERRQELPRQKKKDLTHLHRK